MEEKIVRSGAPYVLAGIGVLAGAAVIGLGGVLTYFVVIGIGAICFALGKRRFPDRRILVESAPKSGDAQVDALIREARQQLDEIHDANERIADESLSDVMDTIERTGRAILTRLEEQPQMLESLRTLMRYYLPVTLQLLTRRAELEDETSGQAVRVKERIEQAAQQVCEAFQKQLEALEAYRFVSLESEMDVLRDMLRADGLTEEARQEEPDKRAQEQAQKDPFAGLFQ